MFGRTPPYMVEQLLDGLQKLVDLAEKDGNDRLHKSLLRVEGIAQTIHRSATSDYPLEVAREAMERFRASDNLKDQAFALEMIEALALARSERDLWRTQANEAQNKASENDLSSCAVMAIRELLRNNHVPGADFVDDHVHNAVIQRNVLYMLLVKILRAADTDWPKSEQRDELFREAEIRLKKIKVELPPEIVDSRPVDAQTNTETTA